MITVQVHRGGQKSCPSLYLYPNTGGDFQEGDHVLHWRFLPAAGTAPVVGQQLAGGRQRSWGQSAGLLALRPLSLLAFIG
jgi:hypothetical protein